MLPSTTISPKVAASLGSDGSVQTTLGLPRGFDKKGVNYRINTCTFTVRATDTNFSLPAAKRIIFQLIKALWKTVVWVDTGSGWHGYDASFTNPVGIRISYTDRINGKYLETKEDLEFNLNHMQGKLTIEIDQSAMDLLSAQEQILFLIEMMSLPGVTCGRLDASADDFDLQAHPREVYEQLKKGEIIFADVDKIICYEGLDQSTLEETGTTLYIGSPKSSKFARYYDKTKDPVHPMPCYRLEVQAREDKADDLFRFLVLCAKDTVEAPAEKASQVWAKSLQEAIGQCVRCLVPKDPGARQDQPRNWARNAKPAKWLQVFTAGFGKLWSWRPRMKSDVWRKLDWIEKQVLPSIAAIYELGGIYLKETGTKPRFLDWIEAFIRGETLSGQGKVRRRPGNMDRMIWEMREVAKNEWLLWERLDFEDRFVGVKQPKPMLDVNPVFEERLKNPPPERLEAPEWVTRGRNSHLADPDPQALEWHGGQVILAPVS